MGLSRQFVVDIVAGNRAKKSYRLVECEDGFANSIFKSCTLGTGSLVDSRAYARRGMNLLDENIIGARRIGVYLR